MKLDSTVVSALFGASGVVVTSLVGLIVTKVNNKKDVKLSTSERLSNDQTQFYEMVMNEIKEVKKRADEVEQELVQWREEALQLRIENKSLKNRVEELEKLITKYQKGEIKNETYS